MVSSLDGFIAKPDNDMSWMNSTDHYEQGKVLTETDIEAFLKSVDCYLMGSNTYEQALHLGWPYGEHPVYVLTNRNLKSDRENVHFISGDLGELVESLREEFQNIWMVGGADLTKQFLRLNLADEIVLSMIPILLGEGTLLFNYIGIEKRLHLKDTVAYQDGMVELTYSLNT